MSVIKQIFQKWFGLEELPCNTCEVLRTQLANSERERRELLIRLLEPSRPESPPALLEEAPKPLGQGFIPWRVRQQMLEAEDRKKVQLTKDKQKEIDDLEKELGVKESASEV